MKFRSAEKILAVVLLAAVLIVPAAVYTIGDESEAATPDDYYYNKLSDYSKKAYVELLEGIENFDNPIKMGEASLYSSTSSNEEVQENIEIAANAILKDRPDIFWFGKSTGGSVSLYNMRITTQSGVSTIEIIPEYGFDKTTVTNYQNAIDNSLKSFSAGSGTTTDKLKVIHDYIVNNTVYEKTGINIRNIYGTFVDGKVVCEID